MKNYKLFIVTLGVFGIINTEMGVIGILPSIAQHFNVSIANAGMFVSLFAFAVAIAGPTMPLICSRFNRKHLMVFILATFTLCNLISALSDNFTIALLTRIFPAFLHPVYISMAFTLASSSVEEKEAPKAVAKVMMGVSAGMVLGVSMVSFLASTINLTSAMLFFAIVNAVVLLATILFLPSSAPTQKISYGDQLSILKQGRVWISMVGVMLLNGAVFGVYSFISNSLSSSLGLSPGIISMVLFAYGVANIVGNMIAGRNLSKVPTRFIFTVLFALGTTYLLQYVFVSVPYPFLVLLVVWGILAGCVGNINQYWMTSAAPQSPDFANGLFLTATNLGTTFGTAICGQVLEQISLPMIYLVGFVMVLGSAGVFAMRYASSKDKTRKYEMDSCKEVS